VRAQTSVASKRCCIVVANDKRSEPVSTSLFQRASGCAAGVTMGFLRLAAHRAKTLSSPANVIVSAQEGDRRTWEGPFWFTRATNRFISERGTPTSLSTAAAVLSIATKDPCCPIAILPSDFWVARESVLTQAIEKAFGQFGETADKRRCHGCLRHPFEIRTSLRRAHQQVLAPSCARVDPHSREGSRRRSRTKILRVCLQADSAPGHALGAAVCSDISRTGISSAGQRLVQPTIQWNLSTRREAKSRPRH